MTLTFLFIAVISFFYGKYYSYILLNSNNVIEFLIFSFVVILLAPFLTIVKSFNQIWIDLQIPFLFYLYIGRMNKITEKQLTELIKHFENPSKYKRFCLNLLIKRFNKINNTTYNEI